MKLYPPWSVLAPGEPAWLEARARYWLGLDDEEEDSGIAIASPFQIVPGHGHYHLLFSMDASYVGVEMVLAEHLSRECTEPVYAIFEGLEATLVDAYRNGVSQTLEVEPEELAQSLGCPFPEEEEPPEEAPRLLRKAALAEGVHSQEALRVLEEEDGHPLPLGCLRLEDTPQGLLISDGTTPLVFAHITLSARFPLATVYGVTATPSLDNFSVTVLQGGEGRGEFLHPPREGYFFPPVSEIKGERTPERILAVLGIPAEWFRP